MCELRKVRDLAGGSGATVLKGTPEVDASQLAIFVLLADMPRGNGMRFAISLEASDDAKDSVGRQPRCEALR